MGSPRFVSPGAMAGNAIEQFFMQREEEKRQKLLDEFARQKQAEEMAFRQQQEGRIAQQGQAELAARTEDRKASLMGQADARAMNFMTNEADNFARAEQGELARKAATAESATDFTQRLQLEGVDHANRLKEIAATGAQSRMTQAERPVAAARGTTGTLGQVYSGRTSSRLTSALDELEDQVGPTTVGTFRAMALRKLPLPGSVDPTVNFDSLTDQVKALIGFDELNRMRQASPTGGALGQVSERELTYLQSVAGSLDPNQSEDAFRRQLQKVRGEIERVVNGGMDGAPAEATAPTAPTGRRIGRFEIIE